MLDMTHLHAAIPLFPSKPCATPAAIKPEILPEIRLPAYSNAVLNASSFLVYQQLKKNKHPGKYAASTKPSMKRMAIRPPKL